MMDELERLLRQLGKRFLKIAIAVLFSLGCAIQHLKILSTPASVRGLF
jgi:hypothetical protein